MLYISRCKRKFRDKKELKLVNKGGITDLFDNVIKESFRITDDEYDYIVENVSDDEIGYLVSEEMTFSEKRECLKIIEKYLTKFYNEEN